MNNENTNELKNNRPQAPKAEKTAKEGQKKEGSLRRLRSNNKAGQSKAQKEPAAGQEGKPAAKNNSKKQASPQQKNKAPKSSSKKETVKKEANIMDTIQSVSKAVKEVTEKLPAGKGGNRRGSRKKGDGKKAAVRIIPLGGLNEITKS